jgi:hypothetical protein
MTASFNPLPDRKSKKKYAPKNIRFRKIIIRKLALKKLFLKLTFKDKYSKSKTSAKLKKDILIL